MSAIADRIARTIATDINARPEQVAATVALLDGGDTVPFVARHRKEVTGGLDDTQLRHLAERLGYLRDLEKRRASILGEITSQDKLTNALARATAKADTKAVLEDLYLPFKPKRRTKAMIACEKGLEPLLRGIQADRATDPVVSAERYVSDTVLSSKDVLIGARDILAEELGENAALLGRLREVMHNDAMIMARVNKGKHVLFIDGVFSPKSNGDLRFHRVNAPMSKELNALVATISERVARYLERQGRPARAMAARW